jgi:hypothetical protein
MNEARRLVTPEYLEQFCPSVGFERSPRVVGETKWVAQPGRIAYFDHHVGELGTARDLPKPSVRVAARACVPSEVALISQPEFIGDAPVAAQVPAWPRSRRREW